MGASGINIMDCPNEFSIYGKMTVCMLLSIADTNRVFILKCKKMVHNLTCLTTWR